MRGKDQARQRYETHGNGRPCWSSSRRLYRLGFARAEVTLVAPTLDSRFIVDLPVRLIGDRGYDADPLDAALDQLGIEIIAPHRRGRTRPKTQDGRPLRRYRRRWKIEQLFARLWQLPPSHGALRVLRPQLPGVRSSQLYPDPTQKLLMRSLAHTTTDSGRLLAYAATSLCGAHSLCGYSDLLTAQPRICD
jgi:hypothetical protein